MDDAGMATVQGVEGRSLARLCCPDERHVVFRRPRGGAAGPTIGRDEGHQLKGGRYHRVQR